MDCWVQIVDKIFKDIDEELIRANEKYDPNFRSLNEALGTLYAEFCELRNDIIGHEPPHKVRLEAIQVAAMAIKTVQYLDKRSGDIK